MKMYLAGNGCYVKDALNMLDLFDRTNCLESFCYIKDWQIKNIHRFKSFMLDSGAFTFMMQKGKRPDWNEYVDRYGTFVKEHDIKLFIELDIDKLIGKDATAALRKRLEDITGRKPIWVLQEGRTEQDFYRAIEEYKYIAIPLSGKSSPLCRERRGMRGTINKLCNLAHRKKAQVHGLGFTKDNAAEYDFDSVDSTAWIYGNRSGFVYKFNGSGLIKIRAPQGYKLKSREAAINNYAETIKYAEYLEHMGTKLYTAGTFSRRYVMGGTDDV